MKCGGGGEILSLEKIAVLSGRCAAMKRCSRSAGNPKIPIAIFALSIGPVHFFAACRTWFACYDEIDADAHQGDRNEKEEILYRSEHCHLIRSVVRQKSIESKQQD